MHTPTGIEKNTGDRHTYDEKETSRIINTKSRNENLRTRGKTDEMSQAGTIRELIASMTLTNDGDQNTYEKSGRPQ